MTTVEKTFEQELDDEVSSFTNNLQALGDKNGKSLSEVMAAVRVQIPVEFVTRHKPHNVNLFNVFQKRKRDERTGQESKCGDICFGYSLL